MRRRDFLQALAATPLVFGLEHLFGQEAKKPKWFDDALARLKETGRQGVVLVAPDGARERQRFADALLGRLQGESADVRELFCEAVWIVMAPETAKTTVRAATEKENRFLLDSDGKRAGKDTVEVHVIEAADRFLESFRPFIRGEKNERLKARAEAVKLTDEIRGALEKLDDEEMDVRESAVALLTKKADEILPYLAYARLQRGSEERLARLADAINRYFQGFEETKPGPRAPYGTAIREGHDDPCPSCGMGSAPVRTRKFLNLLTE